jgi:hypothetical protein
MRVNKGKGTAENLKQWSKVSKANSDHPGHRPDEPRQPDVKKGGDWKQPQQKSEGRGWAKPTSDLSDNTYTGKGGSKRD